MTKIAVLASHNGSGFDTLHEHSKKLGISIEVLISNNSDSLALQKAKQRGIKSHLVNSKTHTDPDARIYELIKENDCSIVYLSGYMKKISSQLTSNFKIINSHPSLLPKYGGKGMYGTYVHEAVIANNEKISGCTLHYVNDVYDEGEIILQNTLYVNEEDDAQSLEKKIKTLEALTIIEGFKRCLK
jgi:phosphoribosylglycinamide formyltransferase-1